MSVISFYHVDAFTTKPFTGNPAGICLLPETKNSDWMQTVAREINLSETAFLLQQNDGYHLRWFTPVAEVDLCGHATLAASHILWETKQLGRNMDARFHTLSGILTATRTNGWIDMDFPSESPTDAPIPDDLQNTLGAHIDAKLLYFGKNRLDYLVLLDSEEAVRTLTPDFKALAQLECRGTIVTAPSDSSDYDFVSRAFFPRFGIDEDPVTGSAHCCLAPFWSQRLNKKHLTARQISKRGGDIKLQVKPERVIISGQAITVMEGKLYY